MHIYSKTACIVKQKVQSEQSFIVVYLILFFFEEYTEAWIRGERFFFVEPEEARLPHIEYVTTSR